MYMEYDPIIPFHYHHYAQLSEDIEYIKCSSDLLCY